MTEKLKIRQAVLVEGKYDKIKLQQLIDAPIFTTGGFSVFSSGEKAVLLRRIAEKDGLIILTDSDPAGFVIRNKLKGMLPKDKVLHLYAPALTGKEKRKKVPSKAGILGIEGLSAETLRRLFEKSGVAFEDGFGEYRKERSAVAYTKADLYAVGLCGKTDSAARRDDFCAKNDLPRGMTAGALLEAINILGLTLPEDGDTRAARP